MLILVDKFTAFHWAAYQGQPEIVSSIMSCLTADQQLQLLFTQDSGGNTALQLATRWGRTEIVKTLLDHLTPEQQLQLLSLQNNEGKTASQEIAGFYGASNTETIIELKRYQIEAIYRVNYREFAKFT